MTEDDLNVLDRFTLEPAAVGPWEWYGFRDVNRFRRRWPKDGLLGDDSSILMVARGDEPLGFVNWRRASVAMVSYCWEIGIGLLPEARGKGYGTEAQRLLVRYLFAHTMVNRIQASTRIENIPEQRALEKAGFTREGVLRGVAFQDGRWRDGVLYSILRDEVPPDSAAPARAVRPVRRR